MNRQESAALMKLSKKWDDEAVSLSDRIKLASADKDWHLFHNLAGTMNTYRTCAYGLSELALDLKGGRVLKDWSPRVRLDWPKGRHEG